MHDCYAKPSFGDGTRLIEVQVLCLNGEGCILSLLPSTLGREVVQIVSRQLPKRGAKLTLYHLSSPLILHQTLQEQGICMERYPTLSCTYVPTDLLSAWRFVQCDKIELHGRVMRVAAISDEKCRAQRGAAVAWEYGYGSILTIKFMAYNDQPNHRENNG
eukprot:Skav229035  [mRNA]  locus=scaffold1014:231310:234309:+ [translate_table: standard]